MVHAQNWANYCCDIEGLPTLISVDLSWAKLEAPKERKKWIAVWVGTKFPCIDGDFHPHEAQMLKHLQRHIASRLTQLQAVWVGKQSYGRFMGMYFYVDPRRIEKFNFREEIRFPGYEIEFDTKDDPDWEFYYGYLYPEDRDMQLIQNKRVLDVLQSYGDSLTSPRKIEHWLGFSHVDERDKFILYAIDNEFKIEDTFYDHETEYYPYRVHISRMDFVYEDSLEDLVMDLYDMAQKCMGEYDGWETAVVRP